MNASAHASATAAIFARARFFGAALFASYCAYALLVIAYGESPLALLRLLYEGTWGSSYGVAQVLFKATPLLLMGLAADVALRAGLFNVGAEGQLVVGSVAAALLGRALGGLPAVVALPLVLAGSALAGACLTLPASWLKSRRGVHEVLTLLLLNRVVDPAITWALGHGLALEGTVRTANVGPGAAIARLDAWLPAFRGSAASFALLLPLGLLGVRELFFRRTLWGREMVLAAQAPIACRAAGIPVARRLALALAISGALAGLASSATVLGYKGYYEQGLGAGTGFLGLAVALLGRRGAFELVLAALLFATLAQGGLATNARVPRDVMEVVTALVVVAVAALAARQARTAPAAVTQDVGP